MKLFQNGRGNWFGSFLDEEGKRRFISLKTKDEQTARRIAEEIVPRELATARELIHVEIDRYIEFYRPQRSEIHSTDNSNVLYGWATEMVEEHNCVCVQEITTQNLQAWFDQKCQTVKTVTAAAYLLAIQHFLKWAQEERCLVLFNAAKKVRVPKYSKNVRRRFLSLPDLQRLIDSCRDEELKFGLYCMSHAGLRRIEVDNARPEWFDMERRLLHVQPSDTWAPKNGKARTIPLSEEFYGFLQTYGLHEPFMIGKHKEHKGKWRYRFDLQRRFKQLTTELGLKCTFHDLRRTFASLKVSAGVSIFKTARWLGNRVEICERHYAHLSPCDSDIDIGLERKTPAAA